MSEQMVSNKALDKKRVQEHADRLEKLIYKYLKENPPDPPSETLDEFKGSMIYLDRPSPKK